MGHCTCVNNTFYWHKLRSLTTCNSEESQRMTANPWILRKKQDPGLLIGLKHATCLTVIIKFTFLVSGKTNALLSSKTKGRKRAIDLGVYGILKDPIHFWAFQTKHVQHLLFSNLGSFHVPKKWMCGDVHRCEMWMWPNVPKTYYSCQKFALIEQLMISISITN